MENNIDYQQKKKLFLEICKKSIPNRYKYFQRSVGPGFLNKIKRIIFAPEIYIPYLLWKLGFKLNYGKVEKRKLYWGREIEMKILDIDSYFFGKFLLPLDNLTKFFIKNFKENDVFYDIGASYGFYTYLALEFCKEVHSFEPIPYIFESLKNNLKNLNNVFLNNVAVAYQDGFIDFYIDHSQPVSSSIFKDLIHRGKAIKVPTISLESYLKNHNKPTLIKLDVEGSENLIITGSLNFFKNDNPIIAMEVFTGELGERFSLKAINILKDLGYQPYFIDDDGEIHKVNGNLIKFIESKNKVLDNCVFIK
jgi:FkbM family methyltransferase